MSTLKLSERNKVMFAWIISQLLLYWGQMNKASTNCVSWEETDFRKQ